jgi:cold shock CspA family protein
MKRKAKPALPGQPTGTPATGRITKLVRGQGQGYIRLDDRRSVFFDRRDLMNGDFNDLVIGETVAFELIEDRLSGPRAQRIQKTGADISQ